MNALLFTKGGSIKVQLPPIKMQLAKKVQGPNCHNILAI